MSKARKVNLEEMPYADCGQGIVYPEGLKWTKQRKDVYRVLWEADAPLSVIQIYNRIEKEEGGEYAVSTIYRILAAFEEKGLVEKETWMGEGGDKGHSTVAYELKRAGHTHYAICLECRRRIPLKSCPFARIHIGEDTEDFTVTDHRLELYGYCKECREKSDGKIDEA